MKHANVDPRQWTGDGGRMILSLRFHFQLVSVLRSKGAALTVVKDLFYENNDESLRVQSDIDTAA